MSRLNWREVERRRVAKVVLKDLRDTQRLWFDTLGPTAADERRRIRIAQRLLAKAIAAVRKAVRP